MGQDNFTSETTFLQALVPKRQQPERSHVRRTVMPQPSKLFQEMLHSAHSPS